jgi:hypothetical protein
MRRILLLFMILVGSMAAQAQVLPVPEVTQEQSNWCWAGCSDCVLQYYGDTVEQCEIAEYTRTTSTTLNLGPTNCCVSTVSGCNSGNSMIGTGSVQKILENFGYINSAYVGYALDPLQVSSTISANHLLLISWKWLSIAVRHVVVGHGIVGSDSNATVYYMDPSVGEGLHFSTYRWVLLGKNSGWADTHTWQATSVITSYPHVTTGSVPKREEEPIVSPNPATDEVWLQCRPGDIIELWSMDGKRVLAASVAGGRERIDVSTLPRGVYVLKVVGAGECRYERLILQ